MKASKKSNSIKHVLVSVAAIIVVLNVLLWNRNLSFQGTYFMGTRAALTITGVTNIQILRLMSEERMESRQFGTKERIGRYIVIKKGNPLDVQSTLQVKELLLNAINSRPMIKMDGKACDPMPGVAFRIFSGKRHFDVLTCFSCSMLAAQTNPQQKFNHSWADFDQQRDQLLQIAKQALPHDKDLEQS